MIMEKERQIPSDAQLLARWVTILANKLQYHKMLTQSDAFQQAHLTRDLLTALGEGEVEFTYRKEDGIIRKARGTLYKGVCDGYDSYQPKTDLVTQTFHVFNYLRRKGQLRQTRQVFDEDVYNSLMKVLQVLDNELRN